MGSYSHVEIGGYPFFGMKSILLDSVLMIFEDTDKIRGKRRLSDRNSISWTIPNSDEDDIEEYCEYRLPLHRAIERLEIQGFTLNLVRKSFEAGIKNKISELQNSDYYEGCLELEEMLEFLQGYKYEDWKSAMNIFVANVGRDYYLREDREGLPLAQKIILDGDEEDELPYGFPPCDVRLIIRAVMDSVDQHEEIVVDCTELINAGYYSPDQQMATEARMRAFADFSNSSKIVILTEGSTDTFALKASLEILYPHLASLFSFMDFAASKSEGGAPHVVRLLKGFIGAKIANRTIAILDNDTAAKDALNGLKGVTLPDYIKVIQYPELAVAKNYPTIGPQGSTNLDINGLAGSIELYFGKDILDNGDGELSPVQWKGYSQSSQQYQGELLDKTRLQKAFMDKVEKAKRDGPDGFDWSGVEAIWQSVFKSCSSSF